MKPLQPLPLFDTLAHFVERHPMPADMLVQLPATDWQAPDLQIATSFLHAYSGNEATYNAYRREIERLLHWCWLINRGSVLNLTRSAIENYLAFCQAPPVAWIGEKQVPRFIMQHGSRQPNHAWRPFVATVSKQETVRGKTPNKNNYTLSEKSLREIFTVTNTFFNFLIQHKYTEINPVAQIKQKSKYFVQVAPQRKIRRLSDVQWRHVIHAANIMALDSPETHERTLFLIKILYSMYLRISEVTVTARHTPQMKDFHRDHEGRWWFATIGKGNKERIIPVSDEMLDALQRYRAFLQLPPLPSSNENHPLIPKTKGKGGISSTRQIRTIVQACFDKAIQLLTDRNLTAEADELQSCTVHWLRHTGISDDVQFRPTEHVRDDAGHSNSLITDRYVNTQLHQRHDSAKTKEI